MLSEHEIAEIEKKANTYRPGYGFTEPYKTDIRALILDRAELTTEAERLKKEISTLISRISLGLRYECCETCKHSSAYGYVGDRYCRILGEYFTGNVKPPYKTAPDDCPMTVCETAIRERDRLQTENAALKNALRYVSCSCATCTQFGVGVPCNECFEKGWGHYEFDYDRFKDGGGGE